MADPTGWFSRPSLRRRFAVWFGTVFVIGAVALRLEHYRTTVDALERDFDVQLWSRLNAVKAHEECVPDSPLGRHLRHGGGFLSDQPRVTDRAPPRIVGIPVPTLEPVIDTGSFVWFAGVWSRDGTLVDGLDLPAGFEWDADWIDRLDSLWTTAAGSLRLAATTGAHDTVLVVAAPLEAVAAAARQEARYQILTFIVWVPTVLGVAWLALSRVLVPLTTIAATAHRIRAGRFDERIDVDRTDGEFVEMAGMLNDMLDRFDEIRLSMSRFNADVAHQLMNPVHAILLESDAAEEPHNADELAASLARVGGLARRIESICGSLLAYARSSALDPARLLPVDLEPIIAAACDRVVDRAGDRGITLVPPTAGIVVKGDASLLEEVFVNLVINGVEHSPQGGRIEIVCGSDASGCRAAVIDHGAGVPAAVIPELFTRFRSGKAAGHGIGLTLSRRILRSHGGDLVHEPTPGGGATFTLRFPPAA
jgi:signal transduction histidine kinase